MTAAFDLAAEGYDDEFTHSLIGKLQREAVRKAVLREIGNACFHSVLELNCGTGEDAMWLSGLGLDVTATDSSEKMLEVAKKKPGQTQFAKVDLTNLENEFPHRHFDLIFSNFGGLNCLDQKQLQNFFINAQRLLKPDGKLILVIMPKATMWEKVYFLIKGKFGELNRRNDSAVANVSGARIETYYYNPSDIRNIASNFRITTTVPIGFFVPPSYLEPVAQRFPFAMKIAAQLDKVTANFKFLAKYSDHYLISLQKQ